jgi:hypothetical protein
MNLLFLQLAALQIFTSNSLAQNVDQVLNQLTQINESKKCSMEAEKPYCDSMSDVCEKEGAFDDGTGRDISKEDYKKKMTQFYTRIQKNYENAHLKILLDRDSRFDLTRELAMKSVQMELSDDCSEMEITNPLKSDQKECLKKVAALLAKKRTDEELMPFKSILNERSRKDEKFKYDQKTVKTNMPILMGLYDNKLYQKEMESARIKNIELVKDLKSSRKIEKDIFPKVKKIMIEKINSMIEDPELRKKIIQKIENITYDDSECGSWIGMGPGGVPSVSNYLVENAYYNSNSNLFRFCNGFLIDKSSEFFIASVIGHELSHSIDPCNIQNGALPVFKFQNYISPAMFSKDFEAQYPFKNLISCLRSKESMAQWT